MPLHFSHFFLNIANVNFFLTFTISVMIEKFAKIYVLNLPCLPVRPNI